MGNEYTNRTVQAPSMETNQGELARPPIVRFNTGEEHSGFFSENGKPDNAILIAATERSSFKRIFKFGHRSRKRSSDPCRMLQVVPEDCQGVF